MFAACGSPSYQQLFANLKPNFVTAFNKYDVDKNGYIDQAEFAALAEDTIAGRPDMEVCIFLFLFLKHSLYCCICRNFWMN